MAQNIYDNPDFFEGYSQLSRSIDGLAGAPEWPALRALLPDLQDHDVLDLGCGYGWFSRWAAEHGASSVLGLDLSEMMLQRAIEAGHHERISYRREDLEHVQLPLARFSLAFSSLAFHYIVDLGALLRRIHDALIPGGRLVFYIEHPVFMASLQPQWVVDSQGRKVWPVDHYQVEGPRSTDWLSPGVIKQHRTWARCSTCSSPADLPSTMSTNGDLRPKTLSTARPWLMKFTGR